MHFTRLTVSRIVHFQDTKYKRPFYNKQLLSTRYNIIYNYDYLSFIYNYESSRQTEFHVQRFRPRRGGADCIILP